MKKFIYTIFTLCIGIAIGMTSTTIAAPVKEYVQASFQKITFIVNGEEKALDADPLVYQGSTYLPVRTVLNALGYDVGYKADTKTVTADKSIESLSQEIDNVVQKEDLSVNQSAEDTKTNEEQLIKIRGRIDSYKELLKHSESALQRIKSDTSLSEDDKEWAINLRQPKIDSINEMIKQLEMQLEDLQSE